MLDILTKHIPLIIFIIVFITLLKRCFIVTLECKVNTPMYDLICYKSKLIKLSQNNDSQYLFNNTGNIIDYCKFDDSYIIVDGTNSLFDNSGCS